MLWHHFIYKGWRMTSPPSLSCFASGIKVQRASVPRSWLTLFETIRERLDLSWSWSLHMQPVCFWRGWRLGWGLRIFYSCKLNLCLNYEVSHWTRRTLSCIWSYFLEGLLEEQLWKRACSTICPQAKPPVSVKNHAIDLKTVTFTNYSNRLTWTHYSL